jgi:hypothetical protein
VWDKVVGTKQWIRVESRSNAWQDVKHTIPKVKTKFAHCNEGTIKAPKCNLILGLLNSTKVF